MKIEVTIDNEYDALYFAMITKTDFIDTVLEKLYGPGYNDLRPSAQLWSDIGTVVKKTIATNRNIERLRTFLSILEIQTEKYREL
jgi:hypothetical protein